MGRCSVARSLVASDNLEEIPAESGAENQWDELIGKLQTILQFKITFPRLGFWPPLN